VPVKTYGSLFAGVGGIDLGLDESGLDCLFQVEIDEYCQQTLSYHWPNVPKFRDIKDVSGYDLPFVDVIAFGSPCQDLSVAGKQAGLDGERSSLFFEATRIIKEMREKSYGQYPKWTIWENVAGALTSNNGKDFGIVLDEMAKAGSMVIEWSILDSIFFGVPQSRRRVFLVSCFDSATVQRCPSKILPVQESMSGDYKKSIEKKQESSRENARRAAGNDSNIKAFTPSSFAQYREGVGTLRANGGDLGGGSETLLVLDNTIRKLTPLETERLMGWPDNHTLNRADGKQNSDTVRYKMCGNGVVSPVVKWVAEKIINI
jgi:DNA (cytosine-5)-methyltransferase 1